MEETIQPIKWTSIEKGDDHMTMREFRSCVLSGAFIDDDGCGYYATSTARSSVRAVLLDVRHNRVPYIWATHVVWFNR